MLEDTFESMDDQEELEDAAQEEVDKILFEVTNGTSREFEPSYLNGEMTPETTKKRGDARRGLT